MSAMTSPYLPDLLRFLRTVQKPGKSLDNVLSEDSLVATGLIDSLAIIQIVLYLEETYAINFSDMGFDPERLSSISGIIHLIEEAS